ncbi:MAG: DUF2330 domain-containing protein [Myxococcales bacterium]|nr:DUF2330 domain-containing protein [Myxococcales bacterium]
MHSLLDPPRRALALRAVACALPVVAIALTPQIADACGGMFCDAGPSPMPVDQTGENILFVLNDTNVEAHIQIQYDPDADADKFAWVIPMLAVPEFEVGSQKLFDNILAGTVPTYGYNSSAEFCGDLDGGGTGTSDTTEGGSDTAADGVDLDPATIVARAEQALLDEHWREPARGSLALELTNLSLVDPGHEAIGRLRRDAAKILEPRARQASKNKDWTTAVAAYRDLLAIWRDHEDAREAFLEALRQLAREQLEDDDHTALLATADELLNLEPEMFVALKYRADALAGLERWDEAAPAYRAAMRVRPSNKDAKKGYWKARQKLKELKGSEDP